MKDISDFLWENIYVKIFMALFGFTTLVFMLRLFFREIKNEGLYSEKESQKYKEKFYKTLIEGMKIGAVSSFEDVINIYKGIPGYNIDEINYRYSLGRQLRELLVEILSKNIVFDESNEKVLEAKKMIMEFIRINDENSPFAELPSAERNALNDLMNYLEKGDSDSSKRKLHELSAMISARNDDLNKIRNTNKWSVPLSIVGVLLTVVFGLIALFKK